MRAMAVPASRFLRTLGWHLYGWGARSVTIADEERRPYGTALDHIVVSPLSKPSPKTSCIRRNRWTMISC
jgi:hypothetical protein